MMRCRLIRLSLLASVLLLLAAAAPPPVPQAPPSRCIVDGVEVEDGELIPSGDPCDHCRCYQGNVRCALIQCDMPACFDYETAPGDCCPGCPNGMNCLALPEGDDFGRRLVPDQETLEERVQHEDGSRCERRCTCTTPGNLARCSIACVGAPLYFTEEPGF